MSVDYRGLHNNAHDALAQNQDSALNFGPYGGCADSSQIKAKGGILAFSRALMALI
jgi:hypothetical protein